MKNIIKKIDDSPILFLVSTAVVVLLLGGGFITLMYFVSLALGEGMSNSFSDTIRNFAWVFSMWATLTGGIVGLRLAWRGRKIQQEQWKTQEKQWKTQNQQWETQQESNVRERLKNLEERYEKAANMLSSELEATRIAACLSLADLGKADETMKSRCVQLLFAFINNPPLKDEEKGKSVDELFPADKPLRFDIQEAITSFSAIYEHYSDAGVDDKPVKLPNYFWVNKGKKCIFLMKANLQELVLVDACLQEANLQGANLQGVDFQWAELWGANLQKVNLYGTKLWLANLNLANLKGANLEGAILWGTSLQWVELEGAILWGANLQGADLQGSDLQGVNLSDADISEADMRQIKNLTKEQILSAIWGYRDDIKKIVDDEIEGWIHSRTKDCIRYSEKAFSGPPKLPIDLEQDEDIQRWLKKPRYDARKKPKTSQ